MKNKIIFLLCLIYFGGGAAMGKAMLTVPQGKLVFGSGQGLQEMNLPSCRTKQLYSNNFSMFTKVSKVDNHRFLFSQTGSSEPGIKIFDLKNKSIQLIYKQGRSPYYNAENKKMFFYYAPSYEVGNGLYEAEISNSLNTAKRIVDARYAYENIISVSDHKIVFIRDDASNSNSVYSYDIITQKLKKLPIQNCTLPQIWRSKTNQLMCFNRDKQQYFLTDLSGNNVEKMQTESNFLPILYLPENDELLFTVTSFSLHDPEMGHLGVYDFATGQSKILCDDIKLGTGDAAYFLIKE